LFAFQKRFTNPITNSDEVTGDLLWHIPITYASKANASIVDRLWLHERQTEITLDKLNSTSFFLVNIQQVGYYRVQYDETNWMNIANELSLGDFNIIPPNSRAMLIDDASIFFENGMLKLKILLEIIKYLEHDVSKIRFL
jgi:aminopeptidase N